MRGSVGEMQGEWMGGGEEGRGRMGGMWGWGEGIRKSPAYSAYFSPKETKYIRTYYMYKIYSIISVNMYNTYIL